MPFPYLLHDYDALFVLDAGNTVMNKKNGLCFLIQGNKVQ